MKQNIEAFLCYFLTWLTGLFFFILETENRFVRFHAIQSFLAFTILSIVLSALQTLFGADRFLDYFVINLNPALLPYLFFHNPTRTYAYLFDDLLYLSLIPFFLWLFLMYAAYRGMRLRLPVVGSLAEKAVKSVYNS